MRSLVLSLVLTLAAVGTLAVPSAGYADYRPGGIYRGGYAGWRGGSHVYGGRGYYGGYGSLYGGYGGWHGGSHYRYPSYLGGLYYGGYGYYRPRVSIGVGVYPYASYGYPYSSYGYPYSSYGYTPSLLDSYLYSGYDYTSPSIYLSTSGYNGVPAVAPPTYDPGDAAPATPAPAPADDRAHVRVVTPADAQVFFNGSPTRQTGEERKFVTPPLAAGKAYTYTVEARWTENGRPVDQTRTITVSPGEEMIVNFTVPEAPAGPETLPVPTGP